MFYKLISYSEQVTCACTFVPVVSLATVLSESLQVVITVVDWSVLLFLFYSFVFSPFSSETPDRILTSVKIFCLLLMLSRLREKYNFLHSEEQLPISFFNLKTFSYLL